jgi:hypothetical protein
VRNWSRRACRRPFAHYDHGAVPMVLEGRKHALAQIAPRPSGHPGTPLAASRASAISRAVIGVGATLSMSRAAR